MKKMTCREMGGSCDAEIMGDTPEQMKENGRNHVHSMTDDAHKAIVEGMKAAGEEGMAKWDAEFKVKFEALQEE